MRVFLILLLLLAFVVPVAAQDDSRKILYWYDPMVPDQKFNKPGRSPFMDMDLVPFYEEKTGDKQRAPENAVHISPSYRQALGVKTSVVKPHEFGKEIYSFGYVVPSTRLEYAIAVRTAGWIYDLSTSAVGDTVKKGDLLFTFYSPDLMTAQSDFLIGSHTGNAEQRLNFYGMDEQAIAELKKIGKFLEATPFYAPADGTVTTLNVRKGAYVDPEEGNNTILMLQDFSKMWIEAHISLKDLQFLSTGMLATVTVEETGKTYKAVTDYIYPMIDNESRKGVARLVLDNPEGKLKSNALVNVMFEADSHTRLAAPAGAVLYGKDGGHVIEDAGNGYFRPIAVTTGITAHGMTEIISGLREGQSIVTSGQFMIDAESSLSGGMAGMDDAKMPGDSQAKNKPDKEMVHEHKR